MKKLFALTTLSFLTSTLPLKAVQIDLVDVLHRDREEGAEILHVKIQKKKDKLKKKTPLAEAYKDEITIFQMASEGLAINTAEIRGGLAKALQAMYKETRVTINYGKEKKPDLNVPLDKPKTEFTETPQKIQVSPFERNHEEHATQKVSAWAMIVDEAFRSEKVSEKYTQLHKAVGEKKGSLEEALKQPIRRSILDAAHSLVTSICPLIYDIEKLIGQEYQPAVSSSSYELKGEKDDDSLGQGKQLSKVGVKIEEDKNELALVASGKYATVGSVRLKHTGKPQEVREEKQEFPIVIDKKSLSQKTREMKSVVTVTTDNNDFASYQLESDRMKVEPGQKIRVSYEIEVYPNGIMSLGLLNTKRSGWYTSRGESAELILGHGVYKGTYERVVPQGESQTSLVFRNYHLPDNGGAGQTVFTIKTLDLHF